MKKLLTIASKGEHYTSDVILTDDGSVVFCGDADIDIDGSPDWRRDPCGQADTSLHLNGKPINGQEIPFMVVPPEIIKAVGPVVLGCQAKIMYNNKETDAVVADVGPHSKLGEISPKAARNLGINDDPNHGGVDEQQVGYAIWPGKAANVNGVQFELQPYK